MSADAALAGTTLEISKYFQAHRAPRADGIGPQRTGRQAVVSPCCTGRGRPARHGQDSPPVAPRLRRPRAHGRVRAPLGPRLPHRLLLRRRLLPPVRRPPLRSPGFAAVTVFQALGLYTIAALAEPIASCRACSSAGPSLSACCWRRLFSQDRARVLARLAGALVRRRRRPSSPFAPSSPALTRRGLAKGPLTRRAVVYGTGPACESLLKALDADPNSDIRICGVFDDRGVDRAQADRRRLPQSRQPRRARCSTAAQLASTC